MKDKTMGAYRYLESVGQWDTTQLSIGCDAYVHCLGEVGVQ